MTRPTVVDAVAGVNLVASDTVKGRADDLLDTVSELVSKASEARAEQRHGPWSAYELPEFADLLDRFREKRTAFE